MRLNCFASGLDFLLAGKQNRQQLFPQMKEKQKRAHKVKPLIYIYVAPGSLNYIIMYKLFMLSLLTINPFTPRVGNRDIKAIRNLF